MSEEPPPDELDDDLRDLLAAERRRPSAMPPELGERVLERVRDRVAADAPTPSPRSAAPNASIARSALTALGGAVLGAGLHAAVQRPPEPQRVIVERVVERVVERRVEVPVIRFVTAADDAGATPPADVAPRSTANARPAPRDDDDSALVERARVALLRRNASDALAAVEEHARRYPRGQLSEEREVLAVQCLVALGRSADARARAEAFHRRFPSSALAAAVDAATAARPSARGDAG